MYTKTGQIVTGTAATINVELGFVPDFVKVTNLTTMDSCEYKVLDTVNDFGLDTTAGTGAITAAASAAAGLAPYAGAAGDKSVGVTIGAAALPNVNTNLLLVEAGVYSI